MIKFRYDDDGNLIAYEDSKQVGEVVTMGDEIINSEPNEVNNDGRSNLYKQQSTSRRER